MVKVTTTYTGANAVAVEKSVATPLEEKMNGVGFVDAKNPVPHDRTSFAFFVKQFKSLLRGTLSSNPPRGYELSTGRDRGGESALFMGDKTLSKTAFFARWKRYGKR